MTEKDEMFLNTIGNRKKAVFAVISDNDTSLNFIVSMLYSQAFQELYHEADRNGGGLPVHVRVMMDEFANGVTRSTPKTVGITDKSVA